MKKIALTVIALALALTLSRAQKADTRLDMVIREDFFAGLGGDMARFDRAMKKCDEVLAKDPNNPQAMVWHGGGVYFQSGLAFRRCDTAAGIELNQRGLKEMASGVALAPESLQTRIPRGAILIASARFVDDGVARPILETGLADYEKALELQKPFYSQMSVHAKGELLGGLADASRRLGNSGKSREYLERLVRELPGSPYEKQSRRWLGDLAAVGKQERFCLGCHVGPESR